MAEIAAGSRGELADLVTIGITEFLRPQPLARLRESIERFYPDLPVVVVDTGSNLSRGRNRLARAVSTPLVLLCEEDFEFCEQTRIEPLLEVLTHDPEIAGVGGELVEPNKQICWAHNFHRKGDEIVISPSTDAPRRTPGGVDYQPCQLIMNFGLFRCELLRQVLWDENMPLHEHLDYYWRVSHCRNRCMAVARGVSILHHKDGRSARYLRFRNRDFLGLVDAKHGAHFRTERSYVWAACSEERNGSSSRVPAHPRSNFQ